MSFREAFPILSVDDVDRAVDFYTSVFGFEKTFSFEQDGATPPTRTSSSGSAPAEA